MDLMCARAAALGLAATGGSDYRGVGSGRVSALGRVTLPSEAFGTLQTRWPRVFAAS